MTLSPQTLIMTHQDVILDPGRSFVKEQPDVSSLSRRDFLRLGIAAPAGLASAAAMAAGPTSVDVHQQLLELAARQEQQRRARFTAVQSKADLDVLQSDIASNVPPSARRSSCARGAPPVRKTGRSKPATTSSRSSCSRAFPGYFVPALLYKPNKVTAALPGVLSPCGHSATGKAAEAYQILHINLAKRGYVVLTYDPVGQGERSQFWDAGERPLALQPELWRARGPGQPALPAGHQPGPLSDLGRHARAGLPGLAPGGGFVEDRLRRQLRRRHAHRLYRGPRPARSGRRDLLLHHDAPAPDGQPHSGRPVRRSGAGHLRIRQRGNRPRRAARAAGAAADAAGRGPVRFLPDRRDPGVVRRGASGSMRSPARASGSNCIEAAERHGLTLPLRRAVYDWFERWLAGRHDATPVAEIPVTPRPAQELLVCEEGQVDVTFRSRPLLPLALERI